MEEEIIQVEVKEPKVKMTSQEYAKHRKTQNEQATAVRAENIVTKSRRAASINATQKINTQSKPVPK